ncbi:MAG: hypothetical protein ACRDL6_01900 [Solirubrobacterales bacterium]
MTAAVAIAGCGGNGGGSEDEVPPDLARPLLASCGTQGFEKPQPERHYRGEDQSGWQLSYTVSSVDPASRPNATTTILLIEESPELPAEGVRGGHPVSIGGRDVSLRTITQPAPRHAAQWRTGKARYIAISDGPSPARLRRLIACLP